MMKRFFYLIVVAVLFGSTSLAGQSIETSKTDTPPIIDGKLDDAVWQKAKTYSNFISFMPEFGKTAPQKTLAYVAYDMTNLYFAFKCFDKEPEKIVATYYQRDKRSRDDMVGVWIDSHNDGQNAYFLTSNPFGIQRDGLLMSSGGSDMSQDFVWQSAGIKGDDGYTVEMSVPLQSIRFKNSDIVSMKIGFWRIISRNSEQYAFPEWKSGKGSFVSQLGLAEFKGIKYKRIFELLPSITYENRKERDVSDKLVSGEDTKSHAGLTSKIGLTSDLTLDVTYNPDFSHIESDEGQVDVNLRSELILVEKRPFFLEGLEHFNFAATGEGTPITLMVNTRKIREPQLGLKLTGKTGKSGSINSLFAIDDVPDSTTRNYYGILRYKHLIKGDSYIGGIYTGKEFRIGTSPNGNNRGYLHTGGIDTRIRFNGFLYLDTFYLHSFKKDADEADRTDGYAYGGTLGYESDNYVAYLGYHDLAESFDLDPGHLSRTGYRAFSWFVERNLYFKSNFLKRAILGYSGAIAWDKVSSLNEYNHTFFTEWIFPSSSQLWAGYTIGTEIFDGVSYKVNRFAITAQSQPIQQLYLTASYSTGGEPLYKLFTQGDSKKIYVSVLFQPTTKFSSKFSVTHHIFDNRVTGEKKVFDTQIYRNKTSYQINKYLSLRSIIQYHNELKEILADALIEFTYIPGTVIHLGYSPNFHKSYEGENYKHHYDRYRVTNSTIFFKASYLFRF